MHDHPDELVIRRHMVQTWVKVYSWIQDFVFIFAQNKVELNRLYYQNILNYLINLKLFILCRQTASFFNISGL